jgi:hypothetical protein
MRQPDFVAGLGSVAVSCAQRTVLVRQSSVTETIPIVFGNGNDPVELGLVASLNRRNPRCARSP